MISFRLHGRGGQGVHTAGKTLSRALFLSGLQSQDFFISSGGIGYPETAFVRADKQKILTKEAVTEPDYIIIMDMTLDIKGILKDIKDNSIIIYNSSEKTKLSLKKKTKQYTADATGIALMKLNKNMPNTAMLGALAKIFPKISLKSVKTAFAAEFGESAQNFSAMDEGFRGVR
ncbi:MAG TPA: 2-oxoacid:acceptor oxidoreductase family protein [archaeon]|nr:2-oxoacid:acceptor oxidoreductase family protein [archaeon]